MVNSQRPVQRPLLTLDTQGQTLSLDLTLTPPPPAAVLPRVAEAGAAQSEDLQSPQTHKD